LCYEERNNHDTMAKKIPPHTLNRIRRPDDIADDTEDLDDLAQNERIRRQPRDTRTPGNTKQERRQRQKEWGRTINRALRKQRRDENHKP
jgi:hypothetical protein